MPQSTDRGAECYKRPLASPLHDWVQEGLVQVDADSGARMHSRGSFGGPVARAAGASLTYHYVCHKCGADHYTPRPMPNGRALREGEPVRGLPA